MHTLTIIAIIFMYVASIVPAYLAIRRRHIKAHEEYIQWLNTTGPFVPNNMPRMPPPYTRGMILARIIESLILGPAITTIIIATYLGKKIGNWLFNWLEGESSIHF